MSHYYNGDQQFPPQQYQNQGQYQQQGQYQNQQQGQYQQGQQYQNQNYSQQDFQGQNQPQGEKYPFVPTTEPRPTKKSKWLTIGLPILIVALIGGAVAGGVLGSKAARDNAAKASSSNSTSSSTSSSSASAASTTGSPTAPASSAKVPVVVPATTTAAVAPVATGAVIKNLAAWDWSKDKSIGMCLGNWLVLERWMNEDWFVSVAGNNAYDEWAFTETLGPAAATVALQAHFNSWITEADIEAMFQAGINHLRIPVGFWAWIPTVAGEPYVECGQIGQIERILGYAYARGMYAIIDLHGLPGSQNGEESSGHNTTTPSWFGNTANQARSDKLVAVVLAWIGNNPYRSVITGIEVINEPRPYTAAQDQELSDYYARSYTAIQASPYPIAMFLHPGFVANPLTYWLPFVTARVTTPPSLVYEDHPYPGNFPPQTGTANILTQVCTAAKSYLNFPVPVCITEWSLQTGEKSAAFEQTFYASQATAWAWSAGGMYWSWKLIPSKAQLAAGLDYSQYSFTTLLTNTTGTIQVPSQYSLANTVVRANALAYLADLASNCGVAPANAAPYGVAAVPWTAFNNAQAAAATTVLHAPSK